MPDAQEVKSPYPGLRSFEPHEAEIFFGREAHTDRLLEILRREHFLAVIGPSGAGKSSLVRAGLLPGLAAGWLGGASDWRIAILRPGETPFKRLAAELVRSGALGSDESSLVSLPAIEAELRRGPLGLADLLTDVRRGTTEAPFKLLVLVDQFEEIFRYAQAGGTEADESEAFVNLLLASRAAPSADLYVALTMRTDFLGHCVRFLELPEAINHAQYLTPRLTRGELERVITGPALVFDGDVAPELVNELINSLDQDFDQLPLLQHALARMWVAESTESSVNPLLTATNLKALGGLQGALSAHAEELFGKLSEQEQGLAETLFRCITLREGTGQSTRSTRRPQRLEQIAAVAECDWRELEPVVRSFAAESVNFLHYGEPLGPESVIDISHEALIRQWERLRTWAEDEAKQAAELMRWLDRAIMRKQGKGELLTGADLARAVEWRDEVAGRFPRSLWPVRYFDPEAEIGFGETLAFIAESKDSDDERRKQETLKAKAQEQLKLKAFDARAEANLARAEAREWAQGGALVRWSRWFSLAVLTASALLLVPVALSLAQAASRSHFDPRKDLARQLAFEASWLAEREPERAQLLAVEAFETVDIPVSNLAVRQAYGNQSESRLRTLRGHEGTVRGAAFSPDGRTVLTASEDKTARLWDAATGQTLHTLRGHEDSVVSAVFSGRTILTASDDNTARLWDAATGQTLQTLRGHEAAVSSAVFSPDGRTVLTASKDNTARLWDAATGDNLQTLHGHESAVYSAVFSPDGRTILTASADNTARLWDAATGDNLEILRGHEAAVYSAVFSPDGQTVLTASRDNTARLWDAASDANLQTLRGHEGTVTRAIFSPDGRTILTASNDNTARLWDTATGRALQTLRGHEASVDSAVFSRDGRTILTASSDNTARLWPCNVCRPTQALADEILQRVGRRLTAEERAQSGLPLLPETRQPADDE